MDRGYKSAQRQYDRQEPAYRPPKEAVKCDVCQQAIYAGELYYSVCGVDVCQDCLYDQMKFAE